MHIAAPPPPPLAPVTVMLEESDLLLEVGGPPVGVCVAATGLGEVPAVTVNVNAEFENLRSKDYSY